MDIAVLMFNVGGVGGAERITVEWINKMVDLGHNVQLYTIYGAAKSHYELSPKVAVQSCNCAEGISWKDYIKAAFRLRKEIKRSSCKTIIIVGTPLVVFGWISTFFLSIKRVLWDHSAFYYNKAHWRLLCAWLVDYLVVLTSNDNKMYRKKYPIRKAKIVTIHNFITDTANAPIRRTDLSSQRVISVGRLSYEKGVDRLLDVWAKVEPRCDTWQLDIIGQGEMKEELEAKIIDLNLKRVKLLGHRSDIADLMEESSILAMTSRTEGLPMVLLEAQSAALPCIAYDCPSGPSEIIENNQTGILVQDGNVEEFARQLLHLMQSKETLRYLSNNSIVSVKNFSDKNIIPQWINIIN